MDDKFDRLFDELHSLRDEMRTDFRDLRGELAGMRTDVCGDLASLRGEIASMRADQWSFEKHVLSIVGGFAIGLLGLLAAFVGAQF